MKFTILDRDGVLFDTCEANHASYMLAARALNLTTNVEELSRAIKSGSNLNDFYEMVWGGIPLDQLDLLRKRKIDFFAENLDRIRINHYWKNLIVCNPDTFYIATKASYDSTKHLLDSFLPEFIPHHVFSTQSDKLKDKTSIILYLSVTSGIPVENFTLHDDSIDTVDLLVNKGYSAILETHFCEVHSANE
jgi:hypothetical protein